MLIPLIRLMYITATCAEIIATFVEDNAKYKIKKKYTQLVLIFRQNLIYSLQYYFDEQMFY
jgi:hypothetical protein